MIFAHRPFRDSCLLSLVALCACGGVSSTACRGNPFGDLCRYDQFKDALPPTVEKAEAKIATMEDPVVRATAVELWLRLHPNTPPTEGAGLCDLLLEGEKQNCARRVNSPHLHR